ncbi:Antidote-toxin recognition MazE, bacterial antitoxin [uncultured archaeon]|nr:Antidote-toxin recognition MazE, bacterial antitoxin [uncultured archaeon]
MVSGFLRLNKAEARSPKYALNMNKYVKYIGGFLYETICKVGERGQITLPKTIREINGIKAKDRVVVMIEDNRIIIEKAIAKKAKEGLMKEFYIKYDSLNRKTDDDWKFAGSEADRFLDEH